MVEMVSQNALGRPPKKMAFLQKHFRAVKLEDPEGVAKRAVNERETGR